MKKLLLVLPILLLGSLSVRAQVQISLSLDRNLYVVYEPIVVQVTITNLSGHDLELKNVGNRYWFGFDIQGIDGRLVGPRHSDCQWAPISLNAGNALTRSINITPLFPLDDFGTYRISATVFLADLNRYFSSPSGRFEITEGRLLWQQEVGVPNGIGTRLISLLLHPLPYGTALYLRIEDKAKGAIYCTHKLGPFVSYSRPEVEVDSAHSVHVLQSYAPQKFIYTNIGLDGGILARKFYSETAVRPSFKKNAEGIVIVQGGGIYNPNAPVVPIPPAPQERSFSTSSPSEAEGGTR